MGTPFMEYGRSRGKGCDCLGLIIGVAWALDITNDDFLLYAKDPATDDNLNPMEELDSRFVPVGDDYDLAAPGMIALLRIASAPRHMAFVVDRRGGGLNLIHCDSRYGRVVEHNYDMKWIRRTVRLYRFR